MARGELQESVALVHERLHHLRLVGPRLADPVAVVRHLAAVQSQDVSPARWSIGQRCETTEQAVEAALAEGRILRTHVLRPTWHFVLPEDLHVLLEVSGERVRQLIAYHSRQNQVDAKLVARAEKLIGKALAARPLTRDELGEVLARGKIVAEGQRLANIVMELEQAGFVASGPPRGKLQTYALVDQLVPRPRRLSRPDALRETVLRYYTSHGPATLKDLGWWASLPLGEIKKVVAELVDARLLDTAVLAGHTCYFAERAPKSRRGNAFLLQAYDELSVGTQESKHVVDHAGLGRASPFNHLLILGGQLAGRWKRTIRKDLVEIDVLLYREISLAERRVLQAEAQRHAGFVGLADHRVTETMS